MAIICVLLAACLMAQVCAMHVKAVVLEITCGPSEPIHCKDDATDLVFKLVGFLSVLNWWN